MSKHVKVILSGCDDSTHFELEATPNNLDALRSLQAISWEKSDYDCKPILLVEDDQGQRMWEDDLYESTEEATPEVASEGPEAKCRECGKKVLPGEQLCITCFHLLSIRERS